MTGHQVSTTSQENRAATDYAGPRTPTPVPSGHRRAGRGVLVAVMVIALVAAGMARNLAVDYQTRTSAAAATERARSALGGMNTFALALLLGGLRGPLVMVLWSSSENQKMEKDLDDFNTKVEWIRNLQPEFDSVHLFQMWNLAYNISVQMASLPNRYAVIIESLDYGRNVDRSRPDNLNILHQTAQIYSNKLGTVAQERTYYRRRVREDSLDRPVPQVAREGESGFQRRRMDPSLDAQGRVRKEYLVVRHPRPTTMPLDAEWNTGEELQFLPQFEPFTQGVSTYAFAYNYAKRASVLMNVGKQEALQVSNSVIDSRPALELKAWAEEEFERGRAAELKLFGLPVPAERVEMEAPTASMPLDRAPVAPADVEKALFCYRTAARIGAAARAEYRRHLSKPEFVDKAYIYASHSDSLTAMEQLVTGDALYLQAMQTADAAARTPLLQQAAEAYRQSIVGNEIIILKHYIEDPVAQTTFGGVTKDQLSTLPPDRIHEILVRAVAESKKQPELDPYGEDRGEYEGYIARATARLQLIGQ